MLVHAIVQKLLMERIMQPSALCAAIYNTIDPELLYLLWAGFQFIYWKSNIVHKVLSSGEGEYYIFKMFGENEEDNSFVFLPNQYGLITFSTALYIIFAARLLFLSIISFIFELGFLMNAHDLLSKYLRKYGILRRFNIDWFMYVADKKENIKNMFGHELYQDEKLIRQIETNDLGKKFIQEKAELLLFKNIPRNCMCCKKVLKRNQRNTMKLLLPSIYDEKNIIKMETSSIKNWLACHYVVNTPPLLFLLNNSVALTNKNSIKNGSEIFFKQIIMSLKTYVKENEDALVFTGSPEMRDGSNDGASHLVHVENEKININGDGFVDKTNKEPFSADTVQTPKEQINKEKKADPFTANNMLGKKNANLENIFYDIDHDIKKVEKKEDTDDEKAQQYSAPNKNKSKHKGKKGRVDPVHSKGTGEANNHRGLGVGKNKTKGGDGTNTNEKNKKTSKGKKEPTEYTQVPSVNNLNFINTQDNDRQNASPEKGKDNKDNKISKEMRGGATIVKFNKSQNDEIHEENSSKEKIDNTRKQDVGTTNRFVQEHNGSITNVEHNRSKTEHEDTKKKGSPQKKEEEKNTVIQSVGTNNFMVPDTKKTELQSNLLTGYTDNELLKKNTPTEVPKSLLTEETNEKKNPPEVKIDVSKATLEDEKEAITFKNELQLRSEELNAYMKLDNYNSMPLEIKDFTVEEVVKKQYTKEEQLQREMFEECETLHNRCGVESVSGDNNRLTDVEEEANDTQGSGNENRQRDIEMKEKKRHLKSEFERSSVVGAYKNDTTVLQNKVHTNNASFLEAADDSNVNDGKPVSTNDTNVSAGVFEKKGRRPSVLERALSQKKLKTKTSIYKNALIYQSHLLNEEMNLLERSDALNLKRVKHYNRRNKCLRCLCSKSNQKNKMSAFRRDISLEIEDNCFANMRSSEPLSIHENEYITKEMIEVFLKPEEAEEFMKEFDLSGHGKINQVMFRSAIKKAISCRKKFIKSLKGQESILKLVRRLMSILLSFLAVVIILFSFGVSADTIIVTGATLTTAIALILSYMYTSFITSVIFIAFSNPYNIGDRIRLDGGEPLYIRKIRTYTTEFETSTGKIVIYENAKLSNAKIYNESRSKHAYIDITFKVDINTPLVALKELRKSLQYLVDSRPSDFCKTKNLYYGYQLQPGHFYEISFWIKCVEGWGNWRKVFELRTDIYDFVILQLRLLNISYRLPTQKIGFTAPLNVIDNYNTNNSKYGKTTKGADYAMPFKENKLPTFNPSPKHKHAFPFSSSMSLKDNGFDQNYKNYQSHKHFTDSKMYEASYTTDNTYTMLSEQTSVRDEYTDGLDPYYQETNRMQFCNQRNDDTNPRPFCSSFTKERNALEEERMKRQFRERQYAEVIEENEHLDDINDCVINPYYSNSNNIIPNYGIKKKYENLPKFPIYDEHDFAVGNSRQFPILPNSFQNKNNELLYVNKKELRKKSIEKVPFFSEEELEEAHEKETGKETGKENEKKKKEADVIERRVLSERKKKNVNFCREPTGSNMDRSSIFLQNDRSSVGANVVIKNKSIQKVVNRKGKGKNNSDVKTVDKKQNVEDFMFKNDAAKTNNFSSHLFTSPTYYQNRNNNMYQTSYLHDEYSSDDDNSSGYESYEYVKHFSLLGFNKTWLDKQKELKIIKDSNKKKFI